MKRLLILITSALILAACMLPFTASVCRADSETLNWDCDQTPILLPTETFAFPGGRIGLYVVNDNYPNGKYFRMRITSVSIKGADKSVVRCDIGSDGTHTITALPGGAGRTAVITVRAENSEIGSKSCPITVKVVNSRYHLEMDWDWRSNPDVFVPGQTKALNTYLDKYSYTEADGCSKSRVPEEDYSIAYICDSDLISITDGVATARERDAFHSLPVTIDVAFRVTNPNSVVDEYVQTLQVVDRYYTIAAEPYWTEKDEVITVGKPPVTVTEYTADCPEGRISEAAYSFEATENTTDAVSIAEDGSSVTVLSDAVTGEEDFETVPVDAFIEDPETGNYCAAELVLKICPHMWDVIRTEPTYEEDGSIVSHCQICGRDEVEILPRKVQFTDVTDSSVWYYNSVYWAVERGVTSGMGPGTFQPNTICNRAMVVTFLYNMAGKPDVEFVPAFPDVKEDDWYAKTVTWAVQNGITSGFGDGTFRPKTNCNRAMIVTFIKNFIENVYPDLYEEPSPSAPSFPDVSSGIWYENSVRWAAENHITSGRGGYFKPDDPCTRAEVVTFLHNLSELTGN